MEKVNTDFLVSLASLIYPLWDGFLSMAIINYALFVLFRADKFKTVKKRFLMSNLSTIDMDD